jgi:hypothetical protein
VKVAARIKTVNKCNVQYSQHTNIDWIIKLLDFVRRLDL